MSFGFSIKECPLIFSVTGKMIRIYVLLLFCTLVNAMQSKVSPHKEDFQYMTVYEESDDDLIAKKLDIAKRGNFFLLVSEVYLGPYQISMIELLCRNSCKNCYRSSRPKCFVKKVFLQISQNLQENTRARVHFLIKLRP